MASLDGPTSLSLGQFYGPQSSINAATDGISQLGQTIARGPMIQAQGAALGAQTAHAQAQTRSINQFQTDIAQIKGLLGPQADGTLGITHGDNVSQASAIVATNQELGRYFGNVVATSMASRAADPNAPAGAGAARDAFSAASGVQTYGQTETGLTATNTKDRDVARTNAGPGYAAASAARRGHELSYRGTLDTNQTNLKLHPQLVGDASKTDPNTGLPLPPVYAAAGTYGQPAYQPTVAETVAKAAVAPVTVGDASRTDPNTGVPVPPVISTAGAAQGKPAHDPTLANTIAGHTTTPVKVQGQGGATVLVPSGRAEATGANVRPASPTEAQGSVMQDVLTPPPGGGPSGITPEDKNAITDATVATLSGRPPPGQGTVADAAGVDAMIEDRLRANTPTAIQDNKPAQELLDPIRLQATWIHDHDKSVRGDWNAAVTKAVQNVTRSGEFVDTSFRAKGPSLLVLKPGSAKSIVWPPGMPVPPEYGGAAPTVAGTVSSPVPTSPSPVPAPSPASPAPVPASPAPVPPSPTVAGRLSTPLTTPAGASSLVTAEPPAAPATPPPAVLSRLKPGILTTLANGQVWTIQGGQPVQVR